MSEKEYIVSLHKNVDYKAFNKEMIASTGAGSIPKRSAPVANSRTGSKRNTHYMLTDEEVKILRNDPRVYGVEIPPDQRSDIQITPYAVQEGNFSKTTSDSGNFINWGLRRSNSPANPYVRNSVEGGYNYTLDGAGVDIVIHDTGITANHPEWQDKDGSSRLVELDWYQATGLTGSMPTEHYTDYHGHGTHVGATAAGKTYGFAKNARIYAVKVNGLQGPEDPNNGIPVADCFDIIKLWHENKPIDPATGAKRPTIVNMSWGYSRLWTSVSEINYRGTSYTGADIDTGGEIWNFGLVPLSQNGVFSNPVRLPNVDTDVEEMIEAGIHVCIASGNSFSKIDVEGGLDYDNYAEVFPASNGESRLYYHRGSSPYSVDAHMVGNIDSEINSGGLEQKAESSNAGPGVSIWAPGTDIMSACSDVNVFNGDGAYPFDDNFKIANISGTSMAAPQVTGILGLYTQLNPKYTPAQAKTFLENIGKNNQIFSSGEDDDYTNTRSIYNGPDTFLFNKFNSAIKLTLGTVKESSPEQVQPPTYTLSSNASTINEGDTVTINLTTTNVSDGTNIGYLISGVDSNDIEVPLTGTFVVNNNSDILEITVTEDTITEGLETLVISLIGLNESIGITINDTSITPTYSITPENTTVDEGASVTMNISTTEIANGTTLYWTVSEPTEFNISSGSVTVNNNSAAFDVSPAADTLTEGTETFTVSLRIGSISGTIVATSSNITINDTSITPVGTVYNVTVAPGTNTYGEGNKYYIDGFVGASPELNLVEGERYTFRQSDSTNETHPLRFSTTPDGTWGGGTEYTEGVTIVGTAGKLGAYTQITVSTDAPTLYYYCVNHSGMGGTANTPSILTPIYNSLSSPASVNEGETITFTVTTENVADGTTVPYTINGINTNDITAGTLTGNVIINSNVGTTSLTLANDTTTEGIETVILTLGTTDSAGTSTGELTTSTSVNDTSIAPDATYSVTASANNVDEGSSLTFNVATTDIPDGTILYWTVSNSEDFNTSSGSFTITSDSGSFSVTPGEDTTTEGAEIFAASVRTDSTSGTIVATSSNITINDTSTTPPFVADYTITVTNSGNNYLLSGSDRNGSFTNASQPALVFNNGDKVQFDVNSTTASQHPFYIKTTQSTGTGNQVTEVNGQETTTLTWSTDETGTGTYGYQCSIHFSMWNTITIS
jgi:plastocyanin